LFREHCAHCHGISGDGAGPTAAFLNPYPRDFRMGIFKFKSTPIGQKPTHEDLKTILVNGIPGTAMPSFKLLPDDEIEALLQYVQYLSVRGEVERSLIYECANELEANDRLFDLTVADSNKKLFDEQVAVIRSLMADTIEKWLDADNHSITIPARPDDMDLAASIKNGRELFYGPIANCVKCHGDTALGDGQTNDWDDWTKDWTTKIGIDPKDSSAIAPFLLANAHKPRNIRPRNLRLGVYRGGRRPIDIYRRVKNGIEGTPMPAVPQTLQPEEIWHLIDYVRSLQYEKVSESGSHKPENQRERL
jgi:mono/diheme cytochrome c family protein